MEHYTYRVAGSAEEQEHVGLCAEFPRLSHGDETREAALAGIVQLAAGVVADMKQKGETPPDALAERATHAAQMWSEWCQGAAWRMMSS